MRIELRKQKKRKKERKRTINGTVRSSDTDGLPKSDNY